MPAFIVRPAYGGPLVLPLLYGGKTVTRFGEWRGSAKGLSPTYSGLAAIVISQSHNAEDETAWPLDVPQEHVKRYIAFVRQWRYRLFGFVRVRGGVPASRISDATLDRCNGLTWNSADSGTFFMTVPTGTGPVDRCVAPLFTDICCGCLSGAHNKPNQRKMSAEAYKSAMQGYRGMHTGVQRVRIAHTLMPKEGV